MDNFSIKSHTKHLKSHLDQFQLAYRGSSTDLIQWKPSKDSWSMLEILCHLIDEEKKDFKARIKHILKFPSIPAPAIDPSRWFDEGNYHEQEWQHKLNEFIKERTDSIQWLESIDKVDWNSGFEHGKFGHISAYFILKNWVAHDLLHLRQIIRNKYQYLIHQDITPIDYAGKW